MIAYNTIYVDGRRPAQQPSSLQQTYESLRQLDDGVAWIDLYEPTQEEFESVGRESELPPRVIEDAIKPHQRPGRASGWRDRGHRAAPERGCDRGPRDGPAAGRPLSG